MPNYDVNWDKIEAYLKGNSGLTLNEEEQTVVQLLQQLKERKPLLGAVAHTDPKKAWEIFQKQHVDSIPGTSRVINRYWWIRAAAAAVLVAIITSVVFYLNNKTEPSAEYSKRVIESEVKNVTLLLANNKKVELDSISGLVQKGNSLHMLDNPETLVATEMQLDGSETYEESLSYNTLLVPRGKKFQLLLEDGTKVWLNADTRFKFPSKFSNNERKVELEGEAYFEVAKKLNHPFTVKYQDKEIRVLGTAFNIHAYDGEESVTLLKGSIEWTDFKQQIVLLPGQQVKTDNYKDNLVKTRQVNAEDYILWINNTLLLEQKSIKELLNDIVRHYDINLKYMENIPDSIKFSGAFEFPETIDEMLAIMNSMGKLTVKKMGNQLEVSLKQ